jgi:hypothetical protein
MTKKTRNVLIVLLIMAFPFVLFFGFLVFMEEPLPPSAPLPNPNGYDGLVKAGKMVAVNQMIDTTCYEDMDKGQLQAAALANTFALALARASFTNQCQVPLEYSATEISNHIANLAYLKILAQAFNAEGRLAEMENHPNDAANSYLVIIHLGNESAHGGVLIDGLVGFAIESFGTSALQKLIPQLDAKSCRDTAATLEDLDAERQSWQDMLQQENAWSYAINRGWRGELVRLTTAKSRQTAFASYKRKFDANEQKTRQVIIALAARAYELDKGHPPASAADLVPDYLKAIPQDPITGTNMVYSPR